MRKVTLRLPDEVVEAAGQIAKREGMPRAHVLSIACQAGFVDCSRRDLETLAASLLAVIPWIWGELATVCEVPDEASEAITRLCEIPDLDMACFRDPVALAHMAERASNFAHVLRPAIVATAGKVRERQQQAAETTAEALRVITGGKTAE